MLAICCFNFFSPGFFGFWAAFLHFLSYSFHTFLFFSKSIFLLLKDSNGVISGNATGAGGISTGCSRYEDAGLDLV